MSLDGVGGDAPYLKIYVVLKARVVGKLSGAFLELCSYLFHSSNFMDKHHDDDEIRMEASSFSRQQTFLRWGPNRDVRFNLATLFNLRAISLT